MKIRSDFVTNSSSACFIFDASKVTNEYKEDFFNKYEELLDKQYPEYLKWRSKDNNKLPTKDTILSEVKDGLFNDKIFYFVGWDFDEGFALCDILEEVADEMDIQYTHYQDYYITNTKHFPEYAHTFNSGVPWFRIVDKDEISEEIKQFKKRIKELI